MKRFFDPLPLHQTLSIMPTFQCTAACTHCGTLSSPRERTSLDLETILEAIDQAADSGYKAVVFTGGEATLAGAALLQGIKRATSKGLAVRIVTNAHWAVTDGAAEKRIGEFVEVGLTEINYSTGDQHAKFVPVDRVVRATRFAARAGLTVVIMVETVRDRTITRQTIEEHPGFAGLRGEFPNVMIDIVESPWMPLSPSEKGEYADGVTVNRGNLSRCGGCESALTVTTLQADGRLAACCGIGMRMIPELQIGTAGEISLEDADRTARNDFLKRWIRIEGPERILAWAAEHDPSIEWENLYAHKCQACIRLYTDGRVRRVIREHHAEKLADVLFAEWLLYNYDPAGDRATPDRPEAD